MSNKTKMLHIITGEIISVNITPSTAQVRAGNTLKYEETVVEMNKRGYFLKQQIKGCRSLKDEQRKISAAAFARNQTQQRQEKHASVESNSSSSSIPST